MRTVLVIVGVFAMLAAGCDGGLEFRSDLEEAPLWNQPCPDGQCPDGACPLPRDPAPDNSICPYRTVPPVDLPRELRCDNYAGGSCMHASLISILRWQRQYAVADHWRKSYSGAAGVPDLATISERLGLRYAYTTSGDEAFLDWCSRTRRGAAIHYGANHAQSFLGYDALGNAVILDNNTTDRYQRVPRAEFIRQWKGFGGYALTPIYSPSPPRPWL